MWLCWIQPEEKTKAKGEREVQGQRRAERDGRSCRDTQTAAEELT